MLEDLLRPEYKNLRPVWTSSQYDNIVGIRKDNHNNDYTKVVNKAFDMGINKSLTHQSFSKLNKYTDLTIKGKVVFIAESPTISIVVVSENFWREFNRHIILV